MSRRRRLLMRAVRRHCRPVIRRCRVIHTDQCTLTIGGLVMSFLSLQYSSKPTPRARGLLGGTYTADVTLVVGSTIHRVPS